MTRVTQFSSPFLLGFDQVERLLDRVTKNGDGYPPYNIEQIPGDETMFRITLAVAGFTRSDLSITVEENQLVIRGRQTDDTDRTYLHRGIAARQFQRAFVLAEGIEVTDAELANGLLTITLKRPEPDKAVRTIEIRTRQASETLRRPEGSKGPQVGTEKATTE